jgi:hypothetical protein
MAFLLCPLYKYLLLFRPIFTPVFNAHHKNHAIFFARYLF